MDVSLGQIRDVGLFLVNWESGVFLVQSGSEHSSSGYL